MACERSGRVRDAFRALGHDAMSCDIEPTDVDGPHHQGDVLPLLRHKWDLVIAFPPCTDLSLVNAQHLKEKLYNGSSYRAALFFMACYDANAPQVCVENPLGLMSKWFRKPDQVIQPWMWGHPYTKRTHLWLRGLPLLLPECSGPGTTESWTHRKSLGSNRAKVRSETFQGVADAMAAQWTP